MKRWERRTNGDEHILWDFNMSILTISIEVTFKNYINNTSFVPSQDAIHLPGFILYLSLFQSNTTFKKKTICENEYFSADLLRLMEKIDESYVW